MPGQAQPCLPVLPACYLPRATEVGCLFSLKGSRWVEVVYLIFLGKYIPFLFRLKLYPYGLISKVLKVIQNQCQELCFEFTPYHQCQSWKSERRWTDSKTKQNSSTQSNTESSRSLETKLNQRKNWNTLFIWINQRDPITIKRVLRCLSGTPPVVLLCICVDCYRLLRTMVHLKKNIQSAHLKRIYKADRYEMKVNTENLSTDWRPYKQWSWWEIPDEPPNEDGGQAVVSCECWGPYLGPLQEHQIS